jgi:hypothetical protein
MNTPEESQSAISAIMVTGPFKEFSPGPPGLTIDVTQGDPVTKSDVQ